jgi:hypothetical protein
MRQKLLTPCEVSPVGMNIAVLRCTGLLGFRLHLTYSVLTTSMRSNNLASADRDQFGMYLKSFFIPSPSEIKLS